MQKFIVSAMELDKYKAIMDSVRKINVAKDYGFQKTFNGLYRVRNDEQWRKKYYSLFQKMKSGNATFKEIIEIMYECTGRVEASFSSKMLATLNPEKPIWDQYVLSNLGLKKPSSTKNEKRLLDSIKTYSEIETQYIDFMQTDRAKFCIEKFNAVLPDYVWISDVKKIDFYLWKNR